MHHLSTEGTGDNCTSGPLCRREPRANLHESTRHHSPLDQWQPPPQRPREVWVWEHTVSWKHLTMLLHNPNSKSLQIDVNKPLRLYFITATTTGLMGWLCYTSSRSTKDRWRTWVGSCTATPTRRIVKGTASWCQNLVPSPCPTPVRTSSSASCLVLRWLVSRLNKTGWKSVKYIYG